MVKKIYQKFKSLFENNRDKNCHVSKSYSVVPIEALHNDTIAGCYRLNFKLLGDQNDDLAKIPAIGNGHNFHGTARRCRGTEPRF